MSLRHINLLFGLFALVALTVGLPKGKEIIISFSDEDRIVNGQNITIDEFPYIVQIVDKYEPYDGFLCGGTVVSDRHILTAAHCFHGHKAAELAVVGNATLVVGDAGAVTIEVESLYTHPKYNRDTTDYDVAVLKLSEPLPIGRADIKIAKMCTKPWQNKATIQVSGWGYTAEKATTHSNHLQTVFLQTMGPKKCAGIYKQLTSRMSCSVVSKHKDACQGDSGGPAFHHGELCGIVSFGFGCGRNKSPAVFTSVPKVRDFIDEAMKK